MPPEVPLELRYPKSTELYIAPGGGGAPEAQASHHITILFQVGAVSYGRCNPAPPAILLPPPPPARDKRGYRLLLVEGVPQERRRANNRPCCFLWARYPCTPRSAPPPPPRDKWGYYAPLCCAPLLKVALGGGGAPEAEASHQPTILFARLGHFGRPKPLTRDTLDAS